MWMQCRQVNINEICNVERAVSGKIYKAGTCFVKLSASDEFVGQIREPGEIESRYAALEPKDSVNGAYLHIAVSRAFPGFLRRYRTTINLQFDTLEHFFVDWHDDKDAQDYIVSTVGMVGREIREIEKQIECEKEMKRWYLRKMFPDQ